MQISKKYSNGEYYKKYSTMTVTVGFEPAKKYSVKALPFTAHGCTLSLLDENKEEMFKSQYTYMSCDPGFHTKMASEIAETINLLLEMEELKEKINSADLEETMLEVLNHCELMDERELYLNGYAAEIVFQ